MSKKINYPIGREQEGQEQIERLKSFIEQKEIEDSDCEFIKPYVSVGIIKTAFSFKKRKSYAVLTNKGKGLLGIHCDEVKS